MSDIDGDLAIHVRFDDLQLSIVHEGKAGDLALQQAILLQLGEAWAAGVGVRGLAQGEP